MNEIIVAIFAFSGSALLFIYGEKIVDDVVRHTNKYYPFKYGDAQVIMYRKTAKIIAFAFVAFGMFALFKFAQY